MHIYNDPIDVARVFMLDGKVGWIDPDGDIHPVAMYNHAEFFKSHSDAIPAISALWVLIEEEALSRDAEAWRDDNPSLQWHEYVEPEYNPAYDDERGDMMVIIMRAVYKAGWGRVGTWASGRMELECSSEHERHLSRKARDFAELVGRELQVRTNDLDWVDTLGYLDEIFNPAADAPTA